MSYLQPPPDMSPVVVVKDFGGYVNEYAAATDIYRRNGREVRIHECHSACTMALSLPNVCVYPNSIFKFHQAYDPRNHVTNWQVSDALFQTYPEPVRERLGTLSKAFTILRGKELIDLGVRNCEAPEPRIMLAQAKIQPLPDNAMSGGYGLSTLTGKLESMVPNLGARPEAQPQPFEPKSRRLAPAIPDGMLGTTVPLPPARPDTIEAIVPSEELPAQTGIPMPPPRPKLILVAMTPDLPPIRFYQPIEGSQPVLPMRFTPFPRG